MTLDTYHTPFLCIRHELILKRLIAWRHHEAHIHYGPVLLRRSTYKQRVAVDLIIEEAGLLYIDLIDSLHTADALEPFEGLVHHEYREYRRRIEHGTSIDMGAVVKHSRDITAHLSEGIPAHNRKSDSRRTYILLGTAIDQRIFADIHRTGHYIG